MCCTLRSASIQLPLSCRQTELSSDVAQHCPAVGPIFLIPGKDDWIEAWVADNFFNVSSKFNLCFLRKRRKWKMLSDTKRMLLFSPLRSLGLISNAYCYALFHRSYISELRVELYRHLFHDGFWQRMVQTGKQLTISGWKNYQHIPSIYLHL